MTVENHVLESYEVVSVNVNWDQNNHGLKEKNILIQW